MHTSIPDITGKQLIRLFLKDSWGVGRKAKHGMTLRKRVGNRTRVTFIPDTRASLPIGTLRAILGTKQTGLGKNGLLKLLNKYGI
jgi:predicted RNA binding protein YcfA (HicA-like mRNA interferase family)